MTASVRVRRHGPSRSARGSERTGRANVDALGPGCGVRLDQDQRVDAGELRVAFDQAARELTLECGKPDGPPWVALQDELNGAVAEPHNPS